MENKEDFIPGIYNYCDRWCEQCPLTHRCKTFKKNPPLEIPQEFDGEELIISVQENLSNTVKLLEQVAAEQGLNWDDIQQAAEDFVVEEPIFTSAQKKLKKRSKKYYKVASKWLDANEELLRTKEEEILKKEELGINVEKEIEELNIAFNNIYYYLNFIHTKILRALDGLHDDWMLEEFPIQNDGNGSAKIATIAIRKTISAWETLLQQIPEAEKEILDILVVLTKLLKKTEKVFPNLGIFIRPGFDEMEELKSI